MNSWHELEQRFRALAPALRHYRLDAQWGAAGEFWRITGSTNGPTTTEYEILSTMVGQLLERMLSKKIEADKTLLAIVDPKIRWYNALKLLSPSFGGFSYGEQTNDDKSSAGFIFTGSIRPFAEASANLCLTFHTKPPVRITMPLIYPDLSWYSSQSERKGLPGRCPYTSIHRCPRYFESTALLSDAGITTKISKELHDATLAKWRAHELAPATAEVETSISGGKNPNCYSNFCPEVAYDTFKLFGSTLIRIGDDIDRQAACSHRRCR